MLQKYVGYNFTIKRLILFHSAVGGELVEAAVEFELPDAVEAAKKMFDDWVDNNITVAADLRQVRNDF